MGEPTLGAHALPAKRPLRVVYILTVVALGLLLSAVAATQYLAYQFNYDAALGASWFASLYAPWSFLEWSYRWWDSDPTLFQRAYFVALGGIILSFGTYAMVFFFSQRRAQANTSLHGSAHWATAEDIHHAGLLPAKGAASAGVFVGGWLEKSQLHYLRHDGPEHVAAFAPTRSGKGVGLVLPTLLSWPESVVCLDIKGENWALTAGWRQAHAGNKVLRFDPSDPSGAAARFNPLAEVRLFEAEEVADAQNIATIIVDPDGGGLVDHWQKTSQALITGVILHVLYKGFAEGRQANLSDVATFLSDPVRGIDDCLLEMSHFPHLDAGVHPVVAQSAKDMLNREEREKSSVLSTAVSYLTLYRDPVVAQNIASSDFAIADLMNRAEPVSLYLVVRPSDMARLRPLMRLMLTQILRKLTHHMVFAEGRSVRHYRHRLLLLVDEFPSLGRLEALEQSLGYLAGYGIKAYLILQDMSQLHKWYGRDESIISGCQVRIAFAPNKIETAELVSRMTGTATVVKKAISTSGKRMGLMLGHVSETLQEVQRPLLTADEIMRLPGPEKAANGDILAPGDMLIMPSGHPPIYGKQVLYFKDKVFAARSRVAAPSVSDRLNPDSAADDTPSHDSRERIAAALAEEAS